jgi:hypothetical protein
MNEIELNFAARKVADFLKNIHEADEGFSEVEKFLKIVNPKQANYFREEFDKLDLDEKIEFMNDIKKNSLYLNCPPFFDTPNFLTLFEIYEKYGSIVPEQFYFKDENGKEIVIDNKLICAEMYIIRLKHDSLSKFSTRSGGCLSLSGVPSKNNKLYKEGKARFSKTAIRVGNTLQFCRL